MSVGELLHHAALRLAAPELLSEDPRQEARELVAHALGVVPAELGTRMESPVDATQQLSELG